MSTDDIHMEGASELETLSRAASACKATIFLFLAGGADTWNMCLGLLGEMSLSIRIPLIFSC